MASSKAAILLLFATPLLSSLTALPTTAHSNYNQSGNCEHYNLDMLGPVDEQRGCGQTITPRERLSGPRTAPPTPSMAPPTSSTTTTAAEFLIDLGALKTTINRQVTALYRAANSLQSRLAKDFDLKLPGKLAPCFYVEWSKDQPRSGPGVKLRSDHTTMEKYCAYFSQLLQQHMETSEYEALLTKLRDVKGSLSLLVNALDAARVLPAPGAPLIKTGGKGQAFGDQCFSTSPYQQAVTLLNLQVFLKQYLIEDIKMLHEGTKVA